MTNSTKLTKTQQALYNVLVENEKKQSMALEEYRSRTCDNTLSYKEILQFLGCRPDGRYVSGSKDCYKIPGININTWHALADKNLVTCCQGFWFAVK